MSWSWLTANDHWTHRLIGVERRRFPSNESGHRYLAMEIRAWVSNNSAEDDFNLQKLGHVYWIMIVQEVMANQPTPPNVPPQK